jgi:hypothetical protein
VGSGGGVGEDGSIKGAETRAAGLEGCSGKEVEDERVVVSEGGEGLAAVNTVAGRGGEEKTVKAGGSTRVQVCEAWGLGVAGAVDIRPGLFDARRR